MRACVRACVCVCVCVCVCARVCACVCLLRVALVRTMCCITRPSIIGFSDRAKGLNYSLIATGAKIQCCERYSFDCNIVVFKVLLALCVQWIFNLTVADS